MLDFVFYEFKGMLYIASYIFVIVFLAIVCDLASGLRKAYINKVLRTSKALRCTISKFIQYQGSVIMGLAIDMCLHFTQLYKIVPTIEIKDMPIVSLVICMYLCFVELLSIRENMDVKEKRIDAMAQEKVKLTTKALIKSLGSDKLKSFIDELDKEQDKIDSKKEASKSSKKEKGEG